MKTASTTDPHPVPLQAGRPLDALIAERIFGCVITWMPTALSLLQPHTIYKGAKGYHPVHHYSTDIASAWEVVAEVQRRHPGWRFSLLGGDEQWGYTRHRNTGPLIKGGAERDDTYTVDKTRASLFGWHARFFGSQDPTIPAPMSWGESRHEATPSLAICLASLRAIGEVR